MIACKKTTQRSPVFLKEEFVTEKPVYSASSDVQQQRSQARHISLCEYGLMMVCWLVSFDRSHATKNRWLMSNNRLAMECSRVCGSNSWPMRQLRSRHGDGGGGARAWWRRPRGWSTAEARIPVSVRRDGFNGHTLSLDSGRDSGAR